MSNVGSQKRMKAPLLGQGKHRAPLVVVTGSPGELKGRYSFLACFLCGNNPWTYSIQSSFPNLEEGYKKGQSTSQQTGRIDLSPTTAGRGVTPSPRAELSGELERAGVAKEHDTEPLQTHGTESHLL